VAALVKPAPVAAVSVNPRCLADADFEEFVEQVADADPLRAFATPLLEAVLEAPKTAAVGF
jgi:hypothetical protein